MRQSLTDLDSRALGVDYGLRGYEDHIDTTSDTTQSATRRNTGQQPPKKTAYLRRFCNVGQHSETGVGGLWLRRSRVRAPSVTLQFAGRTRGPVKELSLVYYNRTATRQPKASCPSRRRAYRP